MASSVQTKLECEETINILSEISANPYVTQRQMSFRAHVSLAKVNYLIRALIEKGLVKTENFLTSEHKAAYIYHLTPAGIEERAHDRALLEEKGRRVRAADGRSQAA